MSQWKYSTKRTKSGEYKVVSKEGYAITPEGKLHQKDKTKFGAILRTISNLRKQKSIVPNIDFVWAFSPHEKAVRGQSPEIRHKAYENLYSDIQEMKSLGWIYYKFNN